MTKYILRCLKGSKGEGIWITGTGSESDLVVHTGAGYADTKTKSQSGLVVLCGGISIMWRTSRQTVAALSTAEAELNGAALGWAITVGLR